MSDPTTHRRGLPSRLLALWIGMAVWATGAAAHEGPPFPVLVDEPHPPWVVSVWADPDVGIGTFYVQLQAEPGGTLPADTEVFVSVAPSDGRLSPQRWPTDGETTDFGRQHMAEVDFPTREFWDVDIELSSAVRGVTDTFGFGIEVTPPGYGPIDIVLYMWPFALLGVLFLVALRRRRRWMREAAASAES